MDAALRGLLLAELITQLYNEGGALVIPQGLRLQTVAEGKYTEYRAALSGLTETNVGNVATKLVEMGLNPDAGAIVRLPDVDVRMGEATKRLKHDVANLLGPDKCEQLMELIGQLRERQDKSQAVCGIPDWAAQLKDLRNMLRWDGT
jgi:hypothetical protein